MKLTGPVIKHVDIWQTLLVLQPAIAFCLTEKSLGDNDRRHSCLLINRFSDVLCDLFVFFSKYAGSIIFFYICCRHSLASFFDADSEFLRRLFLVC